MGYEVVELIYDVNEDRGLLRYGFMNKISRGDVSSSRLSLKLLDSFSTFAPTVEIMSRQYRRLSDRVIELDGEIVRRVRYERTG